MKNAGGCLLHRAGRRNFDMTNLEQRASARNSNQLLSVFDGRECVGFILARGRAGYQAFTADEKSLGLYPSQKQAADAITGPRP
jgi:hypothetical protein